MGVKSVGQVNCVKLPEIVVSRVDSSPTHGKKQALPEGKLPLHGDTGLKSAWDWPVKNKSNQSTSLRHSMEEDDLHHNAIEETPSLETRSNKKKPLKVKRRHSERYQSYEMKSRGSIESSTPLANGICRSKSFIHRKPADHLKAIQNKSVCHATRSDTFFLAELSHVDTGRTERRKRQSKLGDTKALIEKYTNGSSAEESLASYQSDLSFLFSGNRSSPGDTGGLSLKRHFLWNKTKDKTPEELNILDLGNSYNKKKKSSSEKTMGGILQERNEIVSPRQTSFHVIHKEKTSPVITGKRVFFNEDSTKVMDVVEVEPTLEFAVRLGRRDSEGGNLSVLDSNSLSSTPVSRSSELKPILKNTGLSANSPSLLNHQQHHRQGDGSSISWSEYYQDSSDSDSDSDCGLTPLSTRQPLRLPNLSWPASRSMVSSPSVISPRLAYDRSASLPLRSKTLSEIPIRRSVSPQKKFQCSKEFAHVLKNLDSDDEEVDLV